MINSSRLAGKIALLLVALAFSISTLAQDKTPIETRCSHETLKHRGVEREYYLYQPSGLDKGAPLVICLHGYTGSAAGGKVALMDVADRHGFAVCYPQGLRDPKGKTGWNVGYPPQEGMKTEGEMCYLFAQKSPDTFKAIASIAGLTLTNMMPLKYKKPIPFMEVHGTQDHTSEWTGDPFNEGGWGAYLAVPVSISHIVVANGCISETITALPRREGRNQVILHHFQNGKPAFKGGPAADVLLYEVIGGNHSWSDKDMDTCEAIWDFFSRYL